MVVSSLPLLLHLDLSTSMKVENRGNDRLCDSHTWIQTTDTIDTTAATSASFLDIVGGTFTYGLAVLHLSGRQRLLPAALRRLLLFEASTLLVLSLSHCYLHQPELLLHTISTCSRLLDLNLHDAFHSSCPWLTIDELCFPTKLKRVDVRGVAVSNGSLAFIKLTTDCVHLEDVQSDWKFSDASFAMVVGGGGGGGTTHCPFKALHLCTFAAATTGQAYPGLTAQGWNTVMNMTTPTHTTPVAAQLHHLSIGNSLNVSDDSLMVTLSLATNLISLHLNRCHHITDRAFGRFGEGLGLVGLFCNSKQKIMNSTISRMSAVPVAVVQRLRGKYKRLHRGESYEFLQSPTSTSTSTTSTTICPSNDGKFIHCPPCSSFEEMDITLHTYEWRCQASYVLSLTTLVLDRCLLLSDSGVQMILVRS